MRKKEEPHNVHSSDLGSVQNQEALYLIVQVYINDRKPPCFMLRVLNDIMKASPGTRSRPF